MKRVLINRSIYFTLLSILISTYSCQKRTEVVLRASEKIVFLSNREAPKRQFDIFSMNFDGAGQLNLTQNVDGVRSISNPLVSPDGKEIVFIVFEAGRRLLQKMNIDGSNQKTLTEIKIDVPDPRFSPDGARIIYVDKKQQHRQIFIMDRDGANRKNISNSQNDEFEARFAPDGSRIVYVTKHSNKHSIWVMNIDGQFSPNGSKIVYSSSRDGGDYDIYLMKKSGRSLRKIFESPSSETEPIFSPDGRNIIFISNWRGKKYRDVLLYNLKKRKTISLTKQLDYINKHASFTADGEKVIFESVKFNNSDIYAVDITGENMINLTNHAKWDCAAAL
jgi:Tol biopolymer transport system component